MKNIVKILILFALTFSYSQKSEKFNLGFENTQQNKKLPDGWRKWGKYDVTIDSIAYKGKKSVKITSSNIKSSRGYVVYKIPANYKGKAIKLEGYMKIKDVKNGFAGLFLRVDTEGNSSIKDMKAQRVTGTKGWQKFSITDKYPEGATNIYIAGMLNGEGMAWFDDFTVTIDDKNIQTLKEIKKEVPKAKLDKEFDKGSKIDITKLNSKSISNLELLGRVWGFLKYHHPEITKGNYNWDYELFRFLPEYLKTKKKAERNMAIVNWINSFGKVEKCINCKPVKPEARVKPDLKWIENQDKILKDKLLEIYKGRSQGS